MAEPRLYADTDLSADEIQVIDRLANLDDTEFDKEARDYIDHVDEDQTAFRSVRLAQRTLDALQRTRGRVQEVLVQAGKPRNQQQKQHRTALEGLSRRLRTEIKILEGLIAGAQPANQQEESLRKQAGWVVAYGLHRDELSLARHLLRDDKLTIDQAMTAIRAIVNDGVPREQAVEAVRTRHQ